jgi:hypothetical protein
MLVKFNDEEKRQLDLTRKHIDYPDNDSLESFLLSESKTGNSFTTLVNVDTNLGNFTLPLTTRKYKDRIVSQLYHAEYFKTQYSSIGVIHNVTDLRKSTNLWRPRIINSSRAILTIPTDSNFIDMLLNSKKSIKRYRKKYGLFPETTTTHDVDLISKTVDRFNTENLGSTICENLESYMFKTQIDRNRYYFTLFNDGGIRKCVLELQVEKSQDIVVHYINTYYDKENGSRSERIALMSYYCIPEIAIDLAKKCGYSKVTIDFGVIFGYNYKLSIPETQLSGKTLIF